MIIAGYESVVTINGSGISGASMASISKQNNNRLITKLGANYYTKDARGNQLPEGFPQVTFSVTKPLIVAGGEPFKYLIDTCVPVSGTIQNSGNSISFQSGYMTKYNVNYSLDEGPNVTMDFTIYGRLGTSRVTGTIPYHTGGTHFANRAYIDLDISGGQGVVTDFSYGIENTIAPIFQLGSAYPIAVTEIGPRKFNMRVKGYVTDDPNIGTEPFIETERTDEVFLNLETYGGDGTALLDRQSGLFSTNSSDVSISIDDEYSFSLDATKVY